MSKHLADSAYEAAQSGDIHRPSGYDEADVFGHEDNHQVDMIFKLYASLDS